MQDYYLKFKDEVEANSVLFDGETPRFKNIDTIGTIYTPINKVDADGYPVMAAVDGYHVNIRLVEGEAGTDLEAFRVTPEPSTPVRVWA